MESNQSNQTNLNSNSTKSVYNDNNNNEENFKFIDYSSFEKINVLNNENDEMFKAYWKDMNSFVTLKKIQSQYLESVQLFCKLNYHQNILSIFGYTEEPNNSENSENNENYLLVMQYADGGNLRHYLRVRQNLSWHDKIQLAIDVTSGLQCIHSHDLVHLSLHPKNIFVHNNRLLIGDLGLSNSISDVSIFENIDILPYIEPNFVSNLSYPRDKKSDIYSLGFILYEISNGGKASFASINHHFELSKKILSGIRENPIVGTPIEYIDLYEQCWDNDPNIRPSASDALARLGRMNLSPVHEGVVVKTLKINVNNNNINENEKSTYDNLNESMSETSTTRNPHDSIMLDFGGVDSGLGLRQQGPNDENERKCQVIPCLPKCRITFGAFLCCMCVILVVACLMLFFLISLLKMKKR